MSTVTVEIEQVAYHRNGVSGAGFYVVKFNDVEEGPMLGVVFDARDPETGELWGPDRPFHNTEVAVFQRDKLAEGDIGFGSNSWRGDRYASALYEAIRHYDEERNLALFGTKEI